MNILLYPQISYVLGGLLASLLAIFIWERYKRPNLVIEIPKKVEGTEPAIQEDQKRAFYHLTVKNSGKSPAYNCRLLIRYFDEKGEKLLFGPINGKWDRGPEPIIYSPIPEKILPNGSIKTKMGETRQSFLVPFCEEIDIHPKMPPEGFGVVVKYGNEAECWPFSSWSYLLGQGHRVNDWKLINGKYIFEVELLYSGKGSSKERFLLVNDGNKMESVEIMESSNKAGKNIITKMIAWLGKYGSIAFTILASLNIVLLVILLSLVDITPLLKMMYISQTIAGTLALFVAFHEAKRKASKIIITVAIELFIFGFFAQVFNLVI